MPASGEIAALFRALSAAVAEAVELTTTSQSYEIDGSAAPGAEPRVDRTGSSPAWADDLRAHLEASVIPALRALDAAAPLERMPEADLWETLRLDMHGHSGHTYLSVYNTLGKQEHVATWGTESGFARVVADWCSCRTDTEFAETSWDAARRERRVVWMPMERQHCLIDPGAYRVVDIVRAVGGDTFTSCEGHPWGGYVGFNTGGPFREIMEVFDRLGWKTEFDVARLPDVRTVAERDDLWRRACAALEAHFGLAPPKPVVIDPALFRW